MRQSRRGFLGRLLTGSFGLAIGSAVTIEPATAAEQELLKAPAILPPLMDGDEAIWLVDGLMRIKQLANRVQADTYGPQFDYIYFGVKQTLRLDFEGPGCYDLAKSLHERFPYASIKLEAPAF